MDKKVCSECDGTGMDYSDYWLDGDGQEMYDPCQACNGTGEDAPAVSEDE